MAERESELTAIEAWKLWPKDVDIFVCGDGSTSICDHVWDGEPVEHELGGSATCSKCGAVAVEVDLMRLP